MNQFFFLQFHLENTTYCISIFLVPSFLYFCIYRSMQYVIRVSHHSSQFYLQQALLFVIIIINQATRNKFCILCQEITEKV